ncbi:MAG: DUF3137 domain-containing protein [Dehalobacterium sp.]|jgi:hypothetical protein
MTIAIWFFIIFFVLTVIFMIRRIVSRSLRQLVSRGLQQKEENSFFEAAALSESELERKIQALRVWAKLPRFCIVVGMVYLFGGAILALTTGHTEITLTHLVVTAILMALLFVLVVIAARKRFDLKNVVGTALALPVLREVFEVCVYKPNSHLSGELIDESGFFNFYDRSTGSDYTEGRYRGVHFLFSDVHLERRDSDSDGKEKYRTVFKGQWLVCDLDRDLGITLRLKEQNTKVLFGTHESESGMSSIQTENIAFNEKFRIMTDDVHGAFYLLTPHFMEYLVSLDERADAQTFFCFTDNKLHIALHSWRDSFETEKVKTGELESLRQSFRDELKCLTDIIDILLQNNKLFEEGLHGMDLSGE